MTSLSISTAVYIQSQVATEACNKRRMGVSFLGYVLGPQQYTLQKLKNRNLDQNMP